MRKLSLTPLAEPISQRLGFEAQFPAIGYARQITLRMVSKP